VSPEQVLLDADMVPVKPEGWVYLAQEEERDGDAEGVLPRSEGKEGEWNWDVIEKERLRGLEVAQKFAEMDGMHGFFDGGREGVLGEYTDLLF
jgi:hypothetical protein